jgi:DNA-binding XRE family transcriptional regulator
MISSLMVNEFDAPSGSKKEIGFAMSDLGRTLRTAREDAGITLSSMAARTGFSRSYLGNIETGERSVTVAVVAAYERVLETVMNRRHLLLGSLAALTVISADDSAVSIAEGVSQGHSSVLTDLQTSHQTDREVARLLAGSDTSLTTLLTWTRRGRPLLRVNAVGILAKTGAAPLDTDIIGTLRGDHDVRQLYLTAVLARILDLPWDHAARLAAGDDDLDPVQISRVAAELSNPYDAGARWCATVLLFRSRDNAPENVAAALLGALRTETSRETLRALGCALAGTDPLSL